MIPATSACFPLNSLISSLQPDNSWGFLSTFSKVSNTATQRLTFHCPQELLISKIFPVNCLFHAVCATQYLLQSHYFYTTTLALYPFPLSRKLSQNQPYLSSSKAVHSQQIFQVLFLGSPVKPESIPEFLLLRPHQLPQYHWL